MASKTVKAKRGTVSPDKAKQILKDGEVRGHPLTAKQKGFFGARAGGEPAKPAKRSKATRKDFRGEKNGKRI